MPITLPCSTTGARDSPKRSNNRAQWCDQNFDKLITEARTKPTQEERTKLYTDAQKVFKEQAPWATIAHSVVFMPMRKNVTGYKMDPLGSHRFDGVDITE